MAANKPNISCAQTIRVQVASRGACETRRLGIFITRITIRLVYPKEKHDLPFKNDDQLTIATGERTVYWHGTNKILLRFGALNAVHRSIIIVML